MNKLKSKIRKAFEKCQESRNNLSKVAETLKKFFLEIEEELAKKNEFIDEFLYYVECILQESSRDVGVERSVQFVAMFSSLFADVSDEEDNLVLMDGTSNLYNRTIELLTEPKVYCHSNKTVRFRVCQLIQHLLGAVPQNAALDEELMDNVTEVMLDRIQDKIPMVRAQAVRSLSRLQQPSLSDCPVIQAYMFHMACDDSPLVRGAVLSNISLTSKSLPSVLDRTRDVAESVRKIAFQVIAQKVSIKALNSSQRLYLIKQGLLDRSKAVQEIVKKQLFQSWLLTFDANLLALLKKLDVIGAYDTCCKAMLAMFDCSPLADLMEGFTLLNEKKLMNLDELTPESSLYWHQLCEFMRKRGADADLYLDQLLPSTLIFADYLDSYFNEVLLPFIEASKEGLSPEDEDDKIEKEFVAEQLIKMAIKLDLSDNAGRRRLNEIFRDAIVSLDTICFPCLISPLASGLFELQSSNASIASDENGKVELTASLVATVREPTVNTSVERQVLLKEDEILNIKQELAKITVFLNEINEELEECVSQKNFVKAGEIQDRIDEAKLKKERLNDQLKPKPVDIEVTVTGPTEKSDVGTLVKCLIVMKESLSSIFECRCSASRSTDAVPCGIPSTLLQLVETLVVPSVLNQSPEVRKHAMLSVAVACMYSSLLASHHFPLLMQAAQADIYIVRVAAIDAVNDLIRMFGIPVLTSSNERSKSAEEDESDSSDHNEEVDDDRSHGIMEKFISMLDEKETEVRFAATCLLASVHISHRVISPAVVSRLILLWYDPSSRDEPALLNIVSNFLDVFPYMSKEAHECIQACALPTLRILFNAPPTSPFASVNVNNVADLIVSITSPEIVEKADLKALGMNPDKKWLKEWSAHDDFAVMFSNEVLSDPTSPYVNTLCKTLCLLELNPKRTDNLRDLEVLATNLMKEVQDKQAIRHIRKFQTQLVNVSKQCKSSRENNVLPTLSEEVEMPVEADREPTVLQPIDMNPTIRKSNVLPKSSDSHPLKDPPQLGNPKRNLSSELVDVSE